MLPRGSGKAGVATRVTATASGWVAAPLSPDHAQKACQRKQRKARKRGRRPAATTRLLAGWLLVLTTLDSAA